MMKSEILFYFISETHYFEKDYSVLGVTFVGPLIMKNAGTFQDCLKQIYQSTAKCVVLNFRDVPSEIAPEFLPLIHKLFATFREKPTFFRVSGVHPDLRKVFLEKGFLQPEELVNNLSDALNSLPPITSSEKKSA